MDILITGVTGFIGQALARRLIAEGQRVYGLVRPGSPREASLPSRLHIIYGDLEHLEEWEEQLYEIETCVHLAWDGAAGEARMDAALQQANAERSLALIRAAAKAGCGRFLFSGSQAEYGMTLERILKAYPDAQENAFADVEKTNEFTPCRPLSEYGKAKLGVLKKALEACGDSGMTYVHMRLFSVFGTGDQPNSLLSLCSRAVAERRSMELGSCEQMWNYLEVRDCAKAIADLCGCALIMSEDPEPEDFVVNVASAGSRILREYVDELYDYAGSKAYSFGERRESPEGIPFLYPDISHLEGLTGFKEQISFEEGIYELLLDAMS